MKLDVIKNEIQKVAEAISLVINIDVTIVNDEMKRIAGTGSYKEMIGEIIPGKSVFNKCFEEKETLIIDNPKENLYCRHCYKFDSCREKAEMSCPIILDGICYGVIGLIAFDEEQRESIISREKELVLFIEKMASLISGNLKAEIKSYAYNIEKKKMIKVIDGMDKSVVSVDEKGKIDTCNSKFRKLFNIDYDPRNMDISKVLDFFSNDVFDSLKKSNKHSSTFYSESANVRGIYNINKIYYKKDLKGFVIDFVDRKDAIRNYNKMNTDYRMTVDDIIGESESIIRVKKNALKAAESSSTILITGESGTGKEMFARAIHFHSSRGDRPFITINCAAIPEELLESELFGYEEGAFTGAKKGGKLGMFERANKGTIFLDEIGDMSIHLQAKLLRVLQEKEIQKVGGKSGVKVDVRIISATNKNLPELVKNGMFREDLYYRLNVLPIELPSLKERKGDIPLLVDYMVKVYSKKLDKNISGVSEEVLNMLEEYNWPGNIRELQNVIEFCINMTNGNIINDINILRNRFRIEEENLKISRNSIHSKKTFNNNFLDKECSICPKDNLDTERSLVNKNIVCSCSIINKDTEVDNKKKSDKPVFLKLDDIEKNEIKKALDYYKPYKNDKDKVAEVLGISKATLYRKIKKYNL
ncbi:Transcriptional regulator containing PAS, AAA-type ATPase, and DNA-binding Fis domains [Peptostreptococcus russellii]|uniref:Transcriptional regulator containing PAS, AAA-type ATPase, and DNA-binding Fis domains n=1 Tax=Peptostreptococcus russellii TaxID=215200 RepID=A0A1H8GDB3_9FIRM|nr:sigma 54-interacting transcriptional regulator [Peptostreptococcus russellii]SEN41714.1 Transcriptional regulator containing PAS, AAA-type ATPase, and DNA-binding Fis domains [Peptostreptococcus russellii]